MENEFSLINKILKEEIERKARISYEIGSADKTWIDTTNEIIGVIEDNGLLQMHKNKNMISYGLLSQSTEPGRMRPYRIYFAVNYDTMRKRFISFRDYFNFSGHVDSALVKSMIDYEVSCVNFEWIILNKDIDFSFDKDNVYFYFDMFGHVRNPMGLVKKVKKEYLTNFIHEGYK